MRWSQRCKRNCLNVNCHNEVMSVFALRQSPGPRRERERDERCAAKDEIDSEDQAENPHGRSRKTQEDKRGKNQIEDAVQRLSSDRPPHEALPPCGIYQRGRGPSNRSPRVSPFTPGLSDLLSRGFEDQSRDFVGMGNQRKMAGLHFYGPGSHAPGHESLEVRIDRAVLGRDGVEARL